MISLKLYFININIKRSISVTNLNGKMSNAHYQILTKHFIERDLGDTPLGCVIKIWDKTPLCIACEKRNEKIIKYLVEQGTDVNKGNNRAETPLHDACNNENEDLIKYLVEHGADINKENINDEIPLFIACERGIEKIIKYLVEHGADINKEIEHGADIYKVIDILNCPIKRYVPRRRL
ncbi:ankyrin repeat-containing domain protein, partial [Neocallimastix sp. 'constans']